MNFNAAMSQIALVTETFAPQFLAAAHKITGRSISELQAASRARLPFFQKELFMNDHVETDACLRAILETANAFKVRLAVFELQSNVSFTDCNKDVCQIDVETLVNILDSAKGKFR